MVGIILNGVTKSFGDTSVLKGIDLDITDGEFLTLVGPSGCGKSTLLRIIAELEQQSGGDVRIGNRLVNSVRAAERNLAMVFQSYALYQHLTVAQNMTVPLRLRELGFFERFPVIGRMMARSKHAAIIEQVRETADVLQIGPLLDRKPGQLSGGQRQRAALGRAMVRKPVAFLMNEPQSNPDTALRVHMRAEPAELHRDLGATFIYVPHDQAAALTMSDRMAVMMGGEILQLAPPEEVYANPSDLRVAQFVGSPKINTWDAVVDEIGRIHVGEMVLARRCNPGHGPRITVGLRPEHLQLVPGETMGSLSGTRVHRENLGADVYLHLDLGGPRIVVRADPGMAHNLTIGDMAHATPLRDKALIFATDGSRLSFAEGAPVAQATEVA
ncbi:MAG: ABC transporter ATP-binding protein [Pseudomonadota bacterium]